MSDSSAPAAMTMPDVGVQTSARRSASVTATHDRASGDDAPRAVEKREKAIGAWRWMVLPVATLIALAVHIWIPDPGHPQRSHAYSMVLVAILALAVLLAAVLQFTAAPLRRWF